MAIAGDGVQFYTEEWQALPFTPVFNTQALTISAAIAHISGTEKVILAVYSDADGLPGSPLPGAKASATDIPDSGQCCDFATVQLPKSVALSAGVRYWLIAAPDNVNAPDFRGVWQISTVDLCAELKLEQSQLWTGFTDEWAATQIKGTRQ